MGRVVGIDYGTKKCGVAATDILQISANSIGTFETKDLFTFLVSYFQKEEVDKLVLGHPKHKDGSDTYVKKEIDAFVDKIKEKYPELIVDFVDEYKTSVIAKEIILKSGIRKSKRRDKTLVDKVSAVLILQRYLGHF